jgi:hypothetical protein
MQMGSTEAIIALAADDDGAALLRHAVDASGASVLHAAAQCGRVSCIEALLTLGVDSTCTSTIRCSSSPAAQRRSNRTSCPVRVHATIHDIAPHMVLFYGHCACVAYQSPAGAEVDARDEQGLTPYVIQRISQMP